ncbi:MAG: DMT family transporter [Pikeienuella sp.]
MHKSGALFPSLVIALSASVWGLYWVPLRAVSDAGVGPAMAVAVFNLPALLIAGIVFAWQFRKASGRLHITMFVGLLAGAGLGSYALGLMLIGVVKATMLFYLTPVWSTLLAMVVLGERPGLGRWSALLLSLIGLALILGFADEDIGTSFGIGEACGLASGLFWAGGAVLMRREEDAPLAAMVFFQYTGLMIFAVLGAFFLTGEGVGPIAGLGPLVISASIIGLVSVFTIFWAVGKISPGRSGLLMMTEVVVAVISAAIFLPEEALKALEWAGAGLILAAAVIEVASTSSATPRSEITS